MKEEGENMIIYLDMDGVIADFDSALDKLGIDKELDDVEEKIKEIAVESDDFFNTLEKFSTSEELVEYVRKVSKGEWGICSTPLRGDRGNSARWKAVWLKENGFTPPEKENMIFTCNKTKWATANGKSNILIDDKAKNVVAWEKAGGIGIRYHANLDSLSYLKRMLNYAIKVAI